MFNLRQITSVLEEKGKSVQWLADQLGYKNPAIYKMFKTNTTTLITFEKICSILEISPVRLMDESLTNSLINQKKGELKMNHDSVPMKLYEYLRRDFEKEQDRVDKLIHALTKLSDTPPNGQKKAV